MENPEIPQNDKSLLDEIEKIGMELYLDHIPIEEFLGDF